MGASLGGFARKKKIPDTRPEQKSQAIGRPKGIRLITENFTSKRNFLVARVRLLNFHISFLLLEAPYKKK